ncbi:hypothetical protein [Bizionia myxarmorum]|uniref:PorT family protein n=1 Tax=Bizionia myxarmorum TaxID=291186 RepID=A0A5D0RDD4_9FLAO|nr:hypothetical protein [Bizionia myxarmorum]TYB78805.1 hypothetical protein ES674_03235 [Bizionia myxarmorum]
MSSKKHIDRIFQESFKDFEAKPNPELWSKIQKQMALETETPKAGFPVWMRLASIAAGLALLITIGSIVFTGSDNSISPEERTVDTQTRSGSGLLNPDSLENYYDDNANKISLETNDSTLNKSDADKLSNLENEAVANTENVNSESSNTNKDAENNAAVISNKSVVNANNTNKVASQKTNYVSGKSNSENRKAVGNKKKNNAYTISTEKVAVKTSEGLGNTDSENKTVVAVNKNAVSTSKTMETGAVANKSKSEISDSEKTLQNNDNTVALTINSEKENSKTASDMQRAVSTSEEKQLSSTKEQDAIAKNAASKNNNKNDTQQNNDNKVASTNNKNNKDANTTNTDNQQVVSNSENNLLKEKSSQDAIAWNAKSSNIPQNEKEKEGNLMVGDSLKSESPSIEEAIAEAEKTIEKEEDEKLVNRWQVQAIIAPVYYNSLGKGSHLDEEFVSNSKSGETNTSYGVNVSYAINKKLAIRSGVNSLKLSYDTDNVILYNSPTTTNPENPNPLRNIDLAPGSQTLSAFSGDNLGFQQINNKLYNAAISQRLSYYEVPVELEYKIVNSRFGLNVIGGMSTFFLNDNAVYSEFEEYKTYIGEANNVNGVSFSTNLGIGMNYKFTDKFLFNLEPTFKYQLNGFDNTSGNFKPYIIGVYTGFSYKF